MSKEIRKWWEDNALDFQEERKIPIEINYGPGSPNEDSLNLIGNVKGKNVLEIGCGGAQCGIAFAKKGANVVGIDLSETQLGYAQKLAKENNVNIEFHQGDITNLGLIESNSKDIVFSSWALLYVEDINSCFKEVYRVLKKEGIFVFSTFHPFWKTISGETLKVKMKYFDVGRYSEPHKKGLFVEYHHKMCDFINAIIESRLSLEKVLEPDSGKDYPEDFWKSQYEDSKKEKMRFIPRTMIIKAKK